eukprot:TRINITY_DN7449_c0_g1_i1.p1 TRINITY_DN7449_c0_g1~~TRINITY_DN7449_c0_g1_i1.p1  ORF type:complete len:380 (-),score=39.79 TRINITY_DN7449_c0_g1_i1:1268-2407(-)
MATNTIVLDTTREQVAATIDAAVAQLGLANSNHGSKCAALNIALVHLSDQIKKLRVSGQLEDPNKGIQLLVKARILASITYHIAYKLAHEPSEGSWSCCWSAKDDPVLDGQLNDTRSLAALLESYAQGTTAEANGQDPGSDLPALRSGVSTLTLTTPSQVDSMIKDGGVLSLPIKDTNQKVICTAKTWISDPASLVSTSRRMVARLEIEEEDEFGKEWDILLPEQKESSTREQTAFLACSGSQQAVVKSLVPEAPRKQYFGNPGSDCGTLLKRVHIVSNGQYTSYQKQQYEVEIQLSSTALEMGLEGGATRTLQVKGRKERLKVSYVCFLQETKEVLAVYLHLRRQHRGMFQFIGIGNYPFVRNVVLGAFLAMGLHSDL